MKDFVKKDIEESLKEEIGNFAKSYITQSNDENKNNEEIKEG